MTVNITPELCWFVLTITMTALLWVPQIIQSIFKVGLKTVILCPYETAMHYADWTNRAKLAHSNAVQNLVIFASLTLLVLALGLSNDMTTLAAVIYFFARAFHYIMTIIAIPLMRIILFLVGVACQIAMPATLFNRL